MLDRLTLAASLEQLSEKLFPDVANTVALAVETYRRIAADSTFVQRARDAESSFLVPSWAGGLCDTVKYDPLAVYSVLAVDGSQVYPDRHISGAGCFRISSSTSTVASAASAFAASPAAGSAGGAAAS